MKDWEGNRASAYCVFIPILECGVSRLSGTIPVLCRLSFFILRRVLALSAKGARVEGRSLALFHAITDTRQFNIPVALTSLNRQAN